MAVQAASAPQFWDYKLAKQVLFDRDMGLELFSKKLFEERVLEISRMDSSKPLQTVQEYDPVLECCLLVRIKALLRRLRLLQAADPQTLQCLDGYALMQSKEREDPIATLTRNIACLTKWKTELRQRAVTATFAR